ncbi:peptide chain release factor N(5)-glutamine methyltransferase [Alkalicoccus urumqiensis]|nr:peptide chain release factor N(5)-glutamine methyltransferase [Alkalicoccus urumqiensis]
MIVQEALNRASSFLEEAGYEKEIAYILLAHHTGWSRARLYAELRSPLPSDIEAPYFRDVEKACSHIPVQHLTGTEMFYGRPFHVNKHVLIPRPETEELIEAVLRHVPAEEPSIVDIGTGSGIIACTLALEIPGASVTAVDISEKALETAEKNAAELGACVTFSHGDLLEPVRGPVDIVVSNPPYIPAGDRLWMKENVTGHEPEGALFAGDDGLDIYRRLSEVLPEYVKKPGLAAFEIGHDQGKAVADLMNRSFPQAAVDVHKDMNGNERVVLIHVPPGG